MTKEQINKLYLEGEFAENSNIPQLIETHISWVILCDRFVYKIKKPIQYSFLDFSTKEKRKFYCYREIELNRRLTDDIYIDVQTIRERANKVFIGEGEGEIIDYAVQMRKLDRNLQMDSLLLTKKVTHSDIFNLAEKIATFHKNTLVIYKKDFLDVQKMFNDLEAESDHLGNHLINSHRIISHAIEIANRFIEANKDLLSNRLKAGFFRDCHGDLHSRNIFLLPSPQPFDCIEFNDDYRQIDVLNEVAFLCMDLDAFGRQDLSDLFLKYYNDLFPCMMTEEDYRLFVFYKSYRSNIRAKVNSLRARGSRNVTEKRLALADAEKYLSLMDSYILNLDSK
jgi:aminoglycoside phosphotransferase family enzyme